MKETVQEVFLEMKKSYVLKNYTVGGVVAPPVEGSGTTETSPLDSGLEIQNSINDIEDKSIMQQLIPSINHIPF